MNKPRGRPPGHPRTRERISAAARQRFLTLGYRGTTMRAVATDAGVDVAAVSYHFGSKQALFAESTQLACGASLVLDRVFAGPPAGLAGRLLDAMLEAWEGSDGPPVEARLAPHDEAVMATLRDYLGIELRGRLVEYLVGPRAGDRASAAVAILGGLVLTRYVNPIEPLATLPAEHVRRLLEPAMTAALSPPPPRVGRR